MAVGYADQLKSERRCSGDTGFVKLCGSSVISVSLRGLRYVKYAQRMLLLLVKVNHVGL